MRLVALSCLMLVWATSGLAEANFREEVGMPGGVLAVFTVELAVLVVLPLGRRDAFGAPDVPAEPFLRPPSTGPAPGVRVLAAALPPLRRRVVWATPSRFAGVPVLLTAAAALLALATGGGIALLVVTGAAFLLATHHFVRALR